MREHDLSRLLESALARFVLAVVGCILALPGGVRAEAPGRIRFNEQVRPVLSDRCFACHGPDEGNRQAELRFDLRDGAVADLGGHAAIVPGNPAESELLARICSADPNMVMPPLSSKKKPLTSEEIAILRQWIEEGGGISEALVAAADGKAGDSGSGKK